jgi:fumarylacetoacetase
MNGKEPLTLAENVTRGFIENGDTLTIKGYCEGQVNGKQVRIGFGECSGKLLPAPFAVKQ